MTGHFNILNIH